MGNRFIFRQSFAGAGRFFALDRTAVAAVFLCSAGIFDGRAGIVGGMFEIGFAEVCRRGHAALCHQIDQHRGAEFGDAQRAEDDRRGFEKPHDILAGVVKQCRIGDVGFPVTIHRHRLEVFAPHDGTHAAATDRIAFPHHDVGKQDAVLTGRTDGGHAPPLLERGNGCRDIASPEVDSRQYFNRIRCNGQYDRPGASAGDEQRIHAGCLQTPGKASAGRTIVDRAGQWRTGHNGKTGGGRGRGAA